MSIEELESVVFVDKGCKVTSVFGDLVLMVIVAHLLLCFVHVVAGGRDLLVLEPGFEPSVRVENAVARVVQVFEVGKTRKIVIRVDRVVFLVKAEPDPL